MNYIFECKIANWKISKLSADSWKFIDSFIQMKDKIKEKGNVSIIGYKRYVTIIRQ